MDNAFFPSPLFEMSPKNCELLSIIEVLNYFWNLNLEFEIYLRFEICNLECGLWEKNIKKQKLNPY